MMRLKPGPDEWTAVDGIWLLGASSWPWRKQAAYTLKKLSPERRPTIRVKARSSRVPAGRNAGVRR